MGQRSAAENVEKRGSGIGNRESGIWNPETSAMANTSIECAWPIVLQSLIELTNFRKRCLCAILLTAAAVAAATTAATTTATTSAAATRRQQQQL